MNREQSLIIGRVIGRLDRRGKRASVTTRLYKLKVDEEPQEVDAHSFFVSYAWLFPLLLAVLSLHRERSTPFAVRHWSASPSNSPSARR